MAGASIIKSPRAMAFLLAAAITALVIGLMTVESSFPLFRYLELKSLDLRFKLRGTRPPSRDIVIVAIDDQSIEALGRFPWPRSYYAEAVDALTADGAKVVAFDLILSEPDYNPLLQTLRDLRNNYFALGLPKSGAKGAGQFAAIINGALDVADSDRILADSEAASGKVIMALVFQGISNLDGRIKSVIKADGTTGTLKGAESDDQLLPDEVKAAAVTGVAGGGGGAFSIPKAEAILVPIDILSRAASGFGFVNFFSDHDGALRWESLAMEQGGRVYPAIGLRMVERGMGLGDGDIKLAPPAGITLGDVTVPTDARGRMLINYYGPMRTITYYPFSQVIDGELPPGTFKDKLVLIGVAATGLGDVWITPFDPNMPGVEKHATVVSNILNREFVFRNRTADLIGLAYIIACGLLIGLVLPKLPPVRMMAISVAVVLLAVTSNYAIFFYTGMWVNIVYPVLNVLMGSGAIVAHQYLTGEREKRQIKQAFKHYLNPALVDELAKNPENLKLGGEKKELTVLFSDVRGFTSISEGMPPERLVQFMNTYLSLMAGIIMDRKGVVDKFIGDAIMAIYGAPLYFEDHPARTCETALEMLAAIDRKRGEWRAMGFPEIHIGIGINTGPMVVGNMGCETRFDYTVMGDSVNLASRLEGLTKAYGVGIVVSQHTMEAAKGFAFRDLDFVRVKGKDQPIKIYELVGAVPLPTEQQAEVDGFHEALAMYRGHKWSEARDAFEALARNHGERALFELYRKRSETFIATPPPEGWDGVFIFTTK